ncbi:siderophore iron transporter [Niveomyces insectorum RCEF 264]|uniref:Siderophore iron transporter n=1 Tax=Niveomyces insectorum RCEF 264 TaxID=1081102 RepID=A0A167QUI7_9HYPO|nr:siderophore iron transporter [Niveomyces insectorum RCEF 264]
MTKTNSVDAAMEKADSEGAVIETHETSNGAAFIDNDADVPAGYWRSYRFLGSVLAIVLLANNLFIGYSMPANILSVIGADLGGGSQISLASLVLTLIKGVGLLLVGSISDVVGRRYFLISGQLVNFVGAIVAARAQNVNTLIGASALVGLGQTTQVLYPLLLQEIVPNKYRGLSQGFISFAVFPTIALGPAFARLMVANPRFGWRALYWLDTITVGVSLILFALCYFPPGFNELQTGTFSKRTQLRRIDYGGFALYAGGLVCLLLALSWGGNKFAWSSATIIALLVVGVVVLIAFAIFETYVPLHTPLLPMTLFKNRSFVVAVIVGSCGQMSWYALNLLWPYHIQDLYTTDNNTVGWMSCATGIALATGELIMGFFCKKGGRIKYQMFVSVALLTILSGIMSIANQHREALAVAMITCVGFCVGWIELITIVVATLVIPPEQIGSGSAFFASTRAVTGTIVTSIYLAIYNNRSKHLMTPDITKAVEAAGLPESSLQPLFTAIANGTASALDAVPGLTAEIRAAMVDGKKSAYATALGDVYLTSIAFGAIALISIFFVKDDFERHFTSFLNKTVAHITPVSKTKAEPDV